MPTSSSRSSEFGLPGNILNLLELGAHLDYRVSDQTRIQRHGLSKGMLCACARIEAHDEVMAIVVGRLQFLRRLREKKGAPVRDTTYDAVLLKNDPASGFGDSGKHISVRSPGYAQTIMRRRWVHTLLLQRGGRAVPASVSPPSPPAVLSQRSLTTPIISYNILTCSLVLPSQSRSFPREKWSFSENVRARSQSPAPPSSASWRGHIATAAPPSFTNLQLILPQHTDLFTRWLLDLRLSALRAN